jgi:RHS repeat-associated protein
MRPATRWNWVATLILGALLLGAGGVRAQSAGTTIAGPFSVPLVTSQTISFSTNFRVPTPLQGSYLLRLQLSAPNSLTAASLRLNGSQIYSLSDFTGGVTSVDKVVTLLASDSIALSVAGVRGTRVTIAVFTVVYPKPISIVPNPLSLTIGGAGTLTVTLAPAPTALGTLTLSNGMPTVASVPGGVGFASGQTSVAIPVTALSGGSSIVTASVNGGQASATVAVDTPPSISLTSPSANNVFQAGASIAVSATAGDADGSVAKVDFYQGGTLIGSATVAPYTFTWANVAPGSYMLSAVATDNQGSSTASAAVTIRVNAPPAVAVTSPGTGASFTAPATISLLASASDSDGTVASVTFYQGTAPIATVSTAPYTFTWISVGQGSYALTVVATDNDGAVTTSAPINITVTAAAAQMYYIVPDHLNTPRLIANQVGTIVWRWDQQEPFGDAVPNGDPNNTGITFDLPLRFPGQYYDNETARHYNAARDYDASIGRYVESDPIGLRGGLDTYAYGSLAPLIYSDASGLAIWFCTRHMRASYIPVANHGYFFDDKTGRCCGDPGYGAKDPLKTCRERGPKKDSCILISSSDSDAEKLLQCCNKKTNENDYWPFFNDCMNVGDDCIREIGMAPPATPDELRWRRCPSCWRK